MRIYEEICVGCRGMGMPCIHCDRRVLVACYCNHCRKEIDTTYDSNYYHDDNDDDFDLCKECAVAEGYMDEEEEDDD